jgi:DNA polymerase III delta subunit
MTPKEIRAAIRMARRLGLEETPLVALAALVTRYFRALDGSGLVGGGGELFEASGTLRAVVDLRPVLTQAALEQALRDAGRSYEPAPGRSASMLRLR